jgi:hypothetical protein
VTKKWSSTASMDGKTKRQASKDKRAELARDLRRLDKEPPEAKFTSVDSMLEWLDTE